MLTVSKDRPLLTTITGSLPRPHWFTHNLQGRPFSLAMTEIGFREQYTDAVTTYLNDQARAGLDLLTDGDARCDCDVGGRSWFGYPAERLTGLESFHVGRGRTASSRDKGPGDIMFEVLETRGHHPGVITRAEFGDLVRHLRIQHARGLLAAIDGGVPEAQSRILARDTALVMQAALMHRVSPPPVFEAFCASRLTASSDVFGTLDERADLDPLIERALPVEHA